MAALPPEVGHQARATYRQFMENPRHPGLHFKQIHGSDRLVAVRAKHIDELAQAFQRIAQAPCPFLLINARLSSGWVTHIGIHL